MESLENLYYAYLDWAIGKITAISSDCRTFRSTCPSFRCKPTVRKNLHLESAQWKNDKPSHTHFPAVSELQISPTYTNLKNRTDTYSQTLVLSSFLNFELVLPSLIANFKAKRSPNYSARVFNPGVFLPAVLT
ncbi:hypothetical protein [Nostoc sp. CCY 9925]|uniref:hypothetical protein n=1 Tax=Nostoc sp. CCY 9925 TaxID=3103865 RepID=UPI0039C70B63